MAFFFFSLSLSLCVHGLRVARVFFERNGRAGPGWAGLGWAGLERME